MIIGNDRARVIENIRLATEQANYNVKVETGDPVLTPEQCKEVLERFAQNRGTLSFRVKTRIARGIANAATRKLNKTTRIVGLERVAGITGGAIVTSNHFSPIDNTLVRAFARMMGKKRLCVVSQETNLRMQGLFGFLMNYADIIPISLEHRYIGDHFEPMLREALDTGDFVLIYPEEEMWFHYRKPRPLKPGAYYYAAKIGVPILSCFAEIRDLPEVDKKGFRKVEYTLHILEPIFPDPEKSLRENKIAMSRRDYLQKKTAYEAVYKKQLNYTFRSDDIAGWISMESAKSGELLKQLKSAESSE